MILFNGVTYQAFALFLREVGENNGLFYSNPNVFILEISAIVLSSVGFVLVFFKNLCLLNLISSFVVSMPFYLTNLSANPAPLFQSAGLSAGGHLGALWGVGAPTDVGRGGGEPKDSIHSWAGTVSWGSSSVWCSSCAIALHSTEDMQHFDQQTGSLKLFSIMCFFFPLS